MILINKMPRGGVGVIPMNASDSCLVLPLPRDTKDIGVLLYKRVYSSLLHRTAETFFTFGSFLVPTSQDMAL